MFPLLSPRRLCTFSYFYDAASKKCRIDTTKTLVEAKPGMLDLQKTVVTVIGTFSLLFVHRLV